jgi:hypothetical protein
MSPKRRGRGGATPRWLQILRAAADVAPDDRGLNRGDLVVGAGGAAPHAFALAAYPQYPDANAVMAKVYGARGMIARGMLSHMLGLFYVTERGRAALRDGPPSKETSR